MQQLILGTGTAIWWLTEPHWLHLQQTNKKKKGVTASRNAQQWIFGVFESVILSKINLNSQKTYSIIKTKMQFLFNIFGLKQIKKK
jgi:hypothetical protein